MAIAFVSIVTPPFDAQYAARSFIAISPRIEPIFTIAPPFLSPRAQRREPASHRTPSRSPRLLPSGFRAPLLESFPAFSPPLPRPRLRARTPGQSPAQSPSLRP